MDNSITIKSHTVTNVEWCFQFDDDEPHVFAIAGGNIPQLTFEMGDDKSTSVVFKKDNKVFKLFARKKEKE
jgi:hypothetical protein